MREGLAAVLLGVLVAAGGCAGVPGIGGDAATSDEVPGVEDGTLENESALLDAHVEAATETGYRQTITSNLTDVRENEPVEMTQRQRTSVAAGATEYRYQVITSGRISSRIIAWGNETVELRRGETGGGDPSYQRSDPQSPGRLAGRAVFEQRLSSAFEVTDVREREDAPDAVVLQVDGVPEDFGVFPDRVDNVTEFEAELVVDTEGRIHSYDAVAIYEIGGVTADYEYTFQMTSFEDPGIEKPEWADAVEG